MERSLLTFSLMAIVAMMISGPTVLLVVKHGG